MGTESVGIDRLGIAGVVVEGVDPRDDAAFADWYAVVQAAERHSRPDEQGYTAQELRVNALQALDLDRDHDVVLLAARDGDRTIGAAQLDLPVRDNLHLCELELLVHPDQRRRGAGRALLAEAERRLLVAGRTTVIAYSDEPPGRPSPAARGAAEALGFRRSQSEARRDIALPLPPELVAALEAATAPHAAAYALVTWRDGVPEPLLEDLAVLHQRMSTDVPLADLEITEVSVDGARVRRQEQRARDMGRSLIGGGAVHRETGRLVAYTDMAVPLAHPERAYQWNTIVLGEHRGHRLGTLVKLVALQRLSREVPEARLISTWNALENAPMIRVNEALGARTNGEGVAWQKRVSGA